ncbi:MAG: glycoside hydrolase [Gloeobacteraceae cyanobacterium ES-bin-316]|nr:glycoside hydrolase [Ferruginibacter sp.]
MKYKIYVGIAAIIIILYLLPAVSYAQFRVVGYVAPGAGSLPAVSEDAMKKLTHLNIAFVNPDSMGNLLLPALFDSIIQQAKIHNVKVLMSIGGGSHNPYYARLLNNDNRKNFIEKLASLATDHQLDGIDVDLEGEAIDKNYDAFITGLSERLKPAGKLLTSALATWNAQLISTAALKKFDFINIMCYDQTGPWRPNEPGPHSTLLKAEEELQYWTVTRGFPKKKVNLGVPFYGYCFGTRYGESMSYGEIVTTFPDAELQDMIVPANGGIIYYNGQPTIQSKTNLALKNAGGVMIWQILQDADGTKSLLSTIDNIVKKVHPKN